MAPLTRIVAEASPELAARLAAATPPLALRTFTGRRGHVRRSWGPGWALVGDAGYFKDPISAHGLTDALRDAELLARAVVAVIVDGADERDALAGYQATRDALSSALFDVTDVIAGHRWTDVEIPDILLALSAAMTDEVKALAALPSLAPQPRRWRSARPGQPTEARPFALAARQLNAVNAPSRQARRAASHAGQRVRSVLRRHSGVRRDALVLALVSCWSPGSWNLRPSTNCSTPAGSW